MMNKTLDLLIVNPGGRKNVYQSLGAELAAVEPPVWAGLIATFIRQRGFSVAILDTNAENLSPEETAEKISELKPTLTAIVVYGHQPSATTQTMPAAGAICTQLKRRSPELKSILIGGHVAALPERTLREEEVDFVSSGEGPVTIAELLEALKGSKKLDSVHDLWYWDGDELNTNNPAPLIQNLDHEMPEIAWTCCRWTNTEHIIGTALEIWTASPMLLYTRLWDAPFIVRFAAFNRLLKPEKRH